MSIFILTYRKHWRGSQAEYAPEAAPMLVFGIHLRRKP